MKNKKFITAKEARKLAENSQAAINTIYTLIQDEAHAGHVSLKWYAGNLSTRCKDRLITTLEANGYTVSIDENELTICW